MAIILSNLNRFTTSFTGRFLGKFAVNYLLAIPPLLAYFATLSCETLVSENKTNDKLQGSLAMYVRCGGVVNNQILKKFVAESISKKIEDQ